MSSRSAAVLIGRPHARGPNLIYTRRLYAEGSLIFAAMARTLSQCLPPRGPVVNLFHACVPQFPSFPATRILWCKKGEVQLESTDETLRAERWRSILMKTCHGNELGVSCSLECWIMSAGN